MQNLIIYHTAYPLKKESISECKEKTTNPANSNVDVIRIFSKINISQHNNPLQGGKSVTSRCRIEFSITLCILYRENSFPDRSKKGKFSQVSGRSEEKLLHNLYFSAQQSIPTQETYHH